MTQQSTIKSKIKDELVSSNKDYRNISALKTISKMITLKTPDRGVTHVQCINRWFLTRTNIPRCQPENSFKSIPNYQVVEGPSSLTNGNSHF